MTALDLDRLRKLCGMFGSAHDGEIANAARMADRMLREAGIGWGDVLQAALPPPRAPSWSPSPPGQRARAWAPASPPQEAEEEYAHWRRMLRACVHRDRREKLSPREAEFMVSLLHRTVAPTERQLAWLTAIYDRVTA